MTTNELEIWKKLNECECVNKVFGDYWLVGDRCSNMFSASGEIYTVSQVTERNGINSYWIPPLYDPIRPERSLWMIAYNLGLYNLEVIASDFLRPDLALAKAIIEQEGKKGEGDGA
jgi:hypothetical protein